MSCNRISTKTIARIAAVQLLYQYHVIGYIKNLEVLKGQIIEFYEEERFSNSKNIILKLGVNHFNLLVKVANQNLVAIDSVIQNHLSKDRELNKLPVLLLALLRVAVSELCYVPIVPHKVVINEFTDITNDMLNDHEVGFVNSILDKISKNILDKI